jgi:hypothetical protein
MDSEAFGSFAEELEAKFAPHPVRSGNCGERNPTLAATSHA